MSILRLYQYLETKRQSKHATGRCSKHDSGERCHEEAHMHQDPSRMLARIPFGLTTGPIEGAEILVAGCRKETVASEMRSNVLKYRETLWIYRGGLPPVRISGKYFRASSSQVVTCARISFTDHSPMTPGSVSCASVRNRREQDAGG